MKDSKLLRPIALFGLLVLSQTAWSKPEEAQSEAVGHCRLIGEVVGNSGYGKNPRWQPIAKTYAQKKAEALGATHIVFTGYKNIGSFNGEADAKAYSCP